MVFIPTRQDDKSGELMEPEVPALAPAEPVMSQRSKCYNAVAKLRAMFLAKNITEEENAEFETHAVAIISSMREVADNLDGMHALLDAVQAQVVSESHKDNPPLLG